MNEAPESVATLPVSGTTADQTVGGQTVAAAGEKPSGEEAENAARTVNGEDAPSVYLGSDLLYEILAADFAYKRGDYRIAFDGMMNAAEKTRDPRLAKWAAEVAVKERNPHEALDAVRLWHKLAPHSAEAGKYLIGFLIIEERLDELQELLSALLAKAKPGERGVLIYQYQQFLGTGRDKVKAFGVMEKIAEPYLDVPEAHIALSQMAFANKDNARAVVEAREALRLKPDSELAVLTLAQAQAEPRRAIQTLTDFLKQYPKSREVRISNARMLIAQKEYDRAKVEFEQLLASQPDDSLTLYSLGLLSIQQNRYEEAERYLKAYLDALEKSGKPETEAYQAIFLLAQLAEEQKHYKAAIEWTDRISEEADAEAWLLAQVKKSQILVKQGKVQDARRRMEVLRKEYPTEEERLVLAEAQILAMAKLNQDAYDLLKASVDRKPSNISLLYDFSLAAEKLKRYDEMESSLRHILEIDPNNQLAYNALGYSFADRNIRLDEAYVLIAKALALAPDDPYVIDSMGWVLFRQGKLKEAELMLRRAYEILPEAEVMTHLGEVLWTAGQQDEARSLFQKAIELDAGNETLQETVRRLDVRL
ncbi:MAG: tetratricopeptide repeat protein [Burkholderiaceae bacterium]|nr:tetratricopeptide repeat protein [Burkholderiaceae bacterium]